jgi:RNA polymerase sigma factor (sigma-70 family)
MAAGRSEGSEPDPPDRALRDLLSRHLPGLREMAHIELGARNRLREQWDSADVAQEAALRIWRQPQTFRGDSDAQFLAFALRVVESVIVDGARRQGAVKRGRDRQAAGDGEAFLAGAAADRPTPSEVAMGVEAAARFFDALQRLDPRYRRVILLRQSCGCSFAEIATELELGSEAQARALLARALAKLAELTIERGGDQQPSLTSRES